LPRTRTKVYWIINGRLLLEGKAAYTVTTKMVIVAPPKVLEQIVRSLHGGRWGLHINHGRMLFNSI
jgi:hypothetical protein